VKKSTLRGDTAKSTISDGGLHSGRPGRRDEREVSVGMKLHCLSKGCDSEEFTPVNIDVVFGPDGKAIEEYIQGDRRARIVGIRGNALVVKGLSDTARKVQLIPMEDLYCLNCGGNVKVESK
jgi:hypothetical protein